MEEENDRAVFDRRGRRARRREASSDGYIVERDTFDSFVVEELLAEVYESLRVGKGSGCSPPCVTRWSGGAVVHDRGALLRRGLRRRTTTHHVVELGSQHYRGQFNVVPGTGCRRGLPPPRAPGARRAATCCRRARLASSFFGGGGGAGAAARRRLAMVFMLRGSVVLVPRGDGCTAL